MSNIHLSKQKNNSKWNEHKEKCYNWKQHFIQLCIVVCVSVICFCYCLLVFMFLFLNKNSNHKSYAFYHTSREGQQNMSHLFNTNTHKPICSIYKYKENFLWDFPKDFPHKYTIEILFYGKWFMVLCMFGTDVDKLWLQSVRFMVGIEIKSLNLNAKPPQISQLKVLFQPLLPKKQITQGNPFNAPFNRKALLCWLLLVLSFKSVRFVIF